MSNIPEYPLLYEKLKVGTLKVEQILIDNNQDLIQIVKDLQEQIKDLQEQIKDKKNIT